MKYLNLTYDDNDPQEVLEIASMMIEDLHKSLETIADLCNEVNDRETEDGPVAMQVEPDTLCGMMRMLAFNARAIRDKVDYSTDLMAKGKVEKSA